MDIRSHDFLLWRKPLLPLNTLLDFNKDISQQEDVLESELIRIFSQPQLLEALYLASPDLHHTFQDLRQGACKVNKKQLYKSLYKYLIRSTSRSTPYGLFAGCMVGNIDDCPTFISQDDHTYTAHARLDMNYVDEMTKSLLKDNYIREQLRFFPNTSLFQAGHTYRYLESSMQNKKRSYTIVAVSCNQYLDKVLALARAGALLSTLASSLERFEVTQEEAYTYLHAMIDAELLVSELQVTVSGKEHYLYLMDTLSRMQGTEATLRNLREIQRLLQSPTHNLSKYSNIKALVDHHFVITRQKDLVQTDLFFHPKQCVLNKQVIKTIQDELMTLAPLAQPIELADLEDFKQRFYERYGEQEIPLLTAVDNEAGIGYGRITAGKADDLPLIEKLRLPKSRPASKVTHDALMSLKQKLYQEAITSNQQVIALTDPMLTEIKGEVDQALPFPYSFYLIGTLISSSTQALDAMDFQFVLKAMAGPTGLKLLGRFCHGDPTLEQYVSQAIQREDAQYPDVIFAEITHLPEARVGNILMRPTMRIHEIPYLAGSSVDTSFQLPPEDLFISLRANKLVLRSQKLNKRIIPILSNAHNFSTGLPCYKLLCDLSYQDNRMHLNWNWGFLSTQPFLPRVTYKHLILRRATWNLDLAKLTHLQLNKGDVLTGVNILRKACQLPQYVQLVEGDNELLLDLDVSLAQELLWHTLFKSKKIQLKEFLPTPENSIIKDNKGSYVHQLIVPFYTHQPELFRGLQGPTTSSESVKRNFSLGSEWLYVKLYTGTKHADQLLKTMLPNFIENLLKNNLIDQWFFIRYYDTDYHLRLRFHHGNHPLFWQAVLEKFYAVLKDYPHADLVHKTQTDVYERELERYGLNTITQFESLFFADSQTVLYLLHALSGPDQEQQRWLLGMKGVDTLFSDFGYSMQERLALCNSLSQRFFEEFRGNKDLQITLNDKYRIASQEIFDCMHAYGHTFSHANSLLQQRSQQLKPIIHDIKASLTLPLDSVVASVIHMFLNRLIVSQPRVHELVIYHFLSKYYKSMIARMEHQNVRETKSNHIISSYME